VSSPSKANAARKTTEPDTTTLDDRVIAMRSEGKSLAAISKEIGVERSIEAFKLLVAAINRRSPAEQKKLRAEETGRLDALEKRVSRRPDELDRARKLKSIAKLRARLAAP
jgi:hypothetical protein